MHADTPSDHTPPMRPWAEPDTRLFGAAWFAVFALSLIGLGIITNQIFNLKILGFRPISTTYYYIVVGLFLPVSFLTSPARDADATRVRWYDWALAALAFGVCMFFAANSESILYKGWEFVAPTYVVVQAGLLVLLALEAVRRCAGFPLFVICAIFASFPLYTGAMPGFLWGVQLSLSETVLSHSLGVESIIGIPIRVIADLLIGFIVFGVALTASGGGVFFMDLASALMGHARGGPAKVAILSSGFFGSLSGSVISNVISTGSMTIPTMKKCGYPAAYAGAVESCASTGGALMPPVMGSVAFVMASFMNVPYADIMVAATIPALLFYLVLLIQTDCYAARNGLKGLPRDQLPKVWRVLRSGWVYLISLAALVVLLLATNAEAKSPFYVTLLLLATALIRAKKDERLKPVIEMVMETGRTIGMLVGVLAGVGLVVGALSITGVGNAFSRELLQYAGGNPYLLLILGAFTSFILGMGMTVSACYIFLAVVLAPALVQGGFSVMASHLFILYWAMLSYITPPVAMAAVAASSIAKAPAMRTGVTAMRLGAILFVLPFLFVLNPALILQGNITEVAMAVSTAILSILMLSAASERYIYFLARPATRIETGVLLVGGLCLLVPEWRTDTFGLVLLALVMGRGFLAAPKRAASAEGTTE
ncbi:TRAP transporter permease [Pseudoprimorskyibacter insulae]|uniref:C4-dicarboxylate TRAP transporter large permease protein DctM n=1 Tax=Pseudoprimorskyibacter insulae TaxID=1695997 RepID=A0A2R8B0D4_9RHOB|nr:TRAP transporter fused permease subunit [Pseudoprimorskyibacter insulae]SPF81731.1 C4-dicarboxylate TRAP transporter large permease protein DctM [Pseudoprimorskyibacter insulae]